MQLSFEEFEKENLNELKKYNHEDREDIYLIAIEQNRDIDEAIFIFDNIKDGI